MTSSNATVQQLTVTERDVQWLAMLDAVISTLLTVDAADDEFEFNINAAERLYAFYYSYDEAMALRQRIHALLPSDTPMRFVAPSLPVQSHTSLVS